MPQFIGSIDDGSDVRGLLLSVAPAPVRAAAAALDRAELAMMESDDERTQLAYAQALTDWTDVGGYDAEHGWDACCTAALGQHYEWVRHRDVAARPDRDPDRDPPRRSSTNSGSSLGRWWQ